MRERSRNHKRNIAINESASQHAFISPGSIRRLVFAAAISLMYSSNISATNPASELGSQSTKQASLVYPLMGPRASSDFGPRKHPINKKRQHHHDGVDLAAPRGAIIRSIAAGTVIYADPYGGYGNLIVVRHHSGFTSHYGHCETLKVRIGERIVAGEVIATVGSTGASTGPHLHFEIRQDGKPHSPEKYLPGLDVPADG